MILHLSATAVYIFGRKIPEGCRYPGIASYKGKDYSIGKGSNSKRAES